MTFSREELFLGYVDPCLSSFPRGSTWGFSLESRYLVTLAASLSPHRPGLPSRGLSDSCPKMSGITPYLGRPPRPTAMDDFSFFLLPKLALNAWSRCSPLPQNRIQEDWPGMAESSEDVAGVNSGMYFSLHLSLRQLAEKVSQRSLSESCVMH